MDAIFIKDLILVAIIHPLKAWPPGEARVHNVDTNEFAGLFIQLELNGVYFTYQHLSESYVKIGDKVSLGDTIGVSGNTGSSGGPHLHVTVATTEILYPSTTNNSDINRNQYIDPRIYIN